jgi:hypothetical protein
VLPYNWPALKEKVLLPYMHDRVRHTGREEITSLERRINDWTRINRE